jgi:predicted RND superfamily exporter protein
MAPRRDFAHWYADSLFRGRKIVLALAALITVWLGWNVQHLKIDNSVEVLFQKDSPIVQAYQKFTRIFGNAELAVVAFRDERGIFHPEVIAEVDMLSQRIAAEVRHVAQVISLTNAQILEGSNGGLVAVPLIAPGAGTDPVALAAALERAHKEPFLDKTLISTDGKTTSIVVKTEYLEGNQFFRKEITDDLRTLLAEVGSSHKTEFYLGGPPVFMTYFDEYILEDMLTFAPLIVVTLVTILWLTFRSWIGILVPMGVVGLGAIWTVGFMGWMGFPITLATTIIPPLLFVTGVEDAIFVLSFFQREATRTDDARKRAWLTSLHTNIACMLTSITTSVGFGALMITDINAVFETGMVSAFGAIAIWASNNLVLPILLEKIPYDAKREEVSKRLESGFLTRSLDKLVDWNLEHPKTVLMIGMLALGAFIPGIWHLKVETNFVKYFRDDSPIAEAQAFIQANLSGVAPLEVLVDSGEPEGMKNPVVLAEMAAIEDTLRADPVVDWVFGTHDFYRIMHRYMAGVTFETGFPITDSAVIGQYALLYEMSGGGAGLEDFVDLDHRYGRISARLKDASTSVLEHTLADAATHFTTAKSGATYSYADNTAMLVGIVDAMLLNTGQSLLLATVVIWLLITIYIRSFTVSLLFMIPNLLPVGAVLGLMGYTGVDLNISTMMIGAVAIGLAVNNTIHIFAHFPRAFAHADGDLAKAAHETMHTVGRACVSSGTALMFGFLILAFSNFYPNVYFGGLSAFTMLVAVVTDISISYTIWILLGKRGYQGPAHLRHQADI